MSLVALALVLGAAVSHATWNLAAKRASSGGLAFVWLCSSVSAALYLPLAVWFLHPLSPAALAVMLLSGLLHLGYFLLLQRGYAIGDLSVVYPLARGTGPLLSVVAAILILGERPGPAGLAGAALVVAGILIIGTSVARAAVVEIDPAATRTASRGGHRLAGAAYGLAAGVLIASYTVLDGAAMQMFVIAPVLFDWGNNAVRLVLIAPYAARRWDTISTVWRDHWREVLAVSVLGPLGYILVLYAFTLAPVSLIAPARELSIVVGTLFGWWLLREQQGVRRLTGAAVVVAGVAALALS